MHKIATWNVNSIRARLPHILRWLAIERPDILAIQETKIIDEDFPVDEINLAGYQVVFSGQRSYNGMAILSKNSGQDIIRDITDFHDPARRVLGITLNDIRILNLYIPNGQAVGSEKYLYKLDWLSKALAYIKSEKAKYPKMIILGDFNIAPGDLDVPDPKKQAGKIMFSDPEKQAFKDMIDLGFVDCFRHLNPTDKTFTWWDYRLYGFTKSLGFRIDHILADKVTAASCLACRVYRDTRDWERPSDHIPVIAEFDV